MMTSLLCESPPLGCQLLKASALPQLALCRFSGYSLVAAMQVGVTQASATSPPEPLAATAARLAQPGWPHGVKGSS